MSTEGHGWRQANLTTAHGLRVHACLRSEPDVLVWLDVVEVALRCIGNVLGRLDDDARRVDGIRISPEDAGDELNERFRRAGFGYRYEGGQIFRIDTEFMHREATVPALRVLSDPRFSGADQEFHAAYDHLKAGEYRDCAVDANNALESTMKAICDAKGWTYEKGARASDLVKLLRREGFFPDFVVLSLEQLLATLKSGLPVVRNEIGGHGQGSAPVEVPEYMAVYAFESRGLENSAAVRSLCRFRKIACRCAASRRLGPSTGRTVVSSSATPAARRSPTSISRGSLAGARPPTC